MGSLVKTIVCALWCPVNNSCGSNALRRRSWSTVGFNGPARLTSLTIDKEDVSKAWVCSELGEDNLPGENNSEDNSHRRPRASEDITPPKDHNGTEVC